VGLLLILLGEAIHAKAASLPQHCASVLSVVSMRAIARMQRILLTLDANEWPT
jgi:hypothetical protein